MQHAYTTFNGKCLICAMCVLKAFHQYRHELSRFLRRLVTFTFRFNQHEPATRTECAVFNTNLTFPISSSAATMVFGWRLTLTALGAVVSLGSAAGGEPSADEPHYTNHFAVEVPGGRERARRAAEQHHCSLIDSVSDCDVTVTSDVMSVTSTSTRVDRLRSAQCCTVRVDYN